MKRTIVFLCLLLNLSTEARTFYISGNGRDANNGLSPGSCWKSISKINSVAFTKGDQILFEKGFSYYGSLVISQDSLTVGSFGRGAKPIITGFRDVDSWRKKNGNIWESRDEVSKLTYCNMVVVNGINRPLGRYPNAGYLTIQSHEGNRSITNHKLDGATNWTGAELVTRLVHFGIERNRIINHKRDRLTYVPLDANVPTDGFGFFIQDDVRTLDSPGEWFYNKALKRLSLYSINTPGSVRLATIDTLISIGIYNHTTIRDLQIEGANITAIQSQQNKYLRVENCDIRFSGVSGISLGTSSDYAVIDSCTINNCNDVGIINDTSARITISNNQIKNTGIFPGMGSKYHANTITWLTTISVFQGIRSCGNYAAIFNNKIDSSGYHGIFFNGDSVNIKNNSINTFCFVMDDGGGIYSYSERSPKVWITRTIKNNIILNGIGAPGGTQNIPGYNNLTAGIFLDAANGNFDVSRNTVANSDKGIFINNGRDIHVGGNTFYNNRYNILLANYSKVYNMENISVYRNFFIAGPSTILNLAWELQPDSVIGKSLPSSFNADSNIYVHQADNGIQVAQNYIGHYRSLAQWKKYSRNDDHSRLKLVRNNKDVKFEYNETAAIKKFILAENYEDASGKKYPPGTYTLPPFSSVVLIRSNANKSYR
jgi:parallel beta-helix repeat protein